MTKLPPNFLNPLDVLSTADSPLIKAVAAMLDETDQRTRTPPEKTRALEPLALLTLMQLFEYDPNARIDDYERAPSLLEAVLELDQNREPSDVQPRWPLTLEGMARLMSAADFLDKTKGIRLEFVAATLLATGANPWADVSEDEPLGRVLPWALMNHTAGLAERIWQCEEGRPSLEALASATPWGKNKNAIATWLDWATDQPHGAPTVTWLLTKGMRPNLKNHPLTMAASTAVVQAYKDHAPLLEEGCQEKILTAWNGRLNRQSLAQDLFLEMKQALIMKQGQQLSEVSNAEEKIIASITKEYGAVPWGKRDEVGWYGNERDIKEPVDIHQLTHRVTIPTGVLQGQWNALTSWLFRRLRSKGNSGWKLTQIFGEEAEHYPRGWLSDAVEFEWRPGISIKGLLAFSLCEIQPNPGKASEDFDQALAAFGIEDFTTWLPQQQAAMVAFYKAFFKGDNAKNKWWEAWQNVFKKNLSLKEQWGDFFVNLRQDIAPIHFLENRSYPHVSHEYTVNFKDGAVVMRGNGFSQWWVQMNHWDGETMRLPTPNAIPSTPIGITELIDTALIMGTDQPEWWDEAHDRANQGLFSDRHQRQLKTLAQDLAKNKKPSKVHQQAQGMLKSLRLAASMPQASTTAKKTRF